MKEAQTLDNLILMMHQEMKFMLIAESIKENVLKTRAVALEQKLRCELQQREVEIQNNIWNARRQMENF